MESTKHLKSDKNDEDDKFDPKHKRNKHKKLKKKHRKRKHSSSSEDSEEKAAKKLKIKHKKKCKKRHKHAKDEKNKDESSIKNRKDEDSQAIIGPEIPTQLLQKAQSMAPMSKEDWEKKQNTIRRVFDEKTGRTRLVRGEGEIIEEIVSRERHQEINRQATLGDGDFFQSKIKKTI